MVIGFGLMVVSVGLACFNIYIDALYLLPLNALSFGCGIICVQNA